MNAVFEEIRTPIGGVPSDRIAQVWDRVEPLLRRVVRRETGYTLPSVRVELQLGHAQLWVVGNFLAVAVTKIVPRPAESVLWVQFIAGTQMNDWLEDWIAVQEAYAREKGCSAVEFNGRRGWAKIREQHREYKPALTVFRREL